MHTPYPAPIKEGLNNGLLVLHIKPAGDSLFSNQKEILNGMNKTTFIVTHCSAFSLQHQLPQSPPSLSPPPPHLRENYLTFTQAIL